MSGAAKATSLPGHLPGLVSNGGSLGTSSVGWVGSPWESLGLFALPSICVSKSKIPERPQGAAKRPN